MLKICIGAIVIILIIVLTVIKIKRENEEYDVEDEPKSAIGVLKKLIDDNPELVEKIAEDNRKKSKKEAEEDLKYNFPIKRSMAINIAQKNNTLKTDFCRNSDRKGISFLGFNNYTIDVIEKNEKKYWQFQVLSGDISWMDFEKNETIYCDGKLVEDDFKFLRCLIDTESGDYIYFPDVKNYEERTVNYEDAINGVMRINEEPPEWLARISEEQ